jgi:hypothetical protein
MDHSLWRGSAAFLKDSIIREIITGMKLELIVDHSE